VVAKITTSIPIVVVAASDLVDMDVVRSLAQPGGNVTGMTLTMPDLDRKRLEVLKEALPLEGCEARRPANQGRRPSASRFRRRSWSALTG